MIRKIFKNAGLFMSFSNCQFTNRWDGFCASIIIPFETVGKNGVNTIFRLSSEIVRYIRIPISPRNFLVTTDILPIVVAIWISDSHPEIMRCSDCLSGFLDYFVIQNCNHWLKKSAALSKALKTIATILRCFSNIIRSAFNVVAVALNISVIISKFWTVTFI